MEVDLSIIIVSYNTEQFTLDCIRSILKSETTFSYEIIVVDNNSSDGIVSKLNLEFPDVSVIVSDKNRGFAVGNNIGIKRAKGKYILLLNSDTLMFRNSLENLLKSAITKKYDITGPVFLNSDFTIQRSWFNFPSPSKIFLRFSEIYLLFYWISKLSVFNIIFHRGKPAFLIKEIIEDTKMDYLSFACILIKRSVIDTLGKLEEGLFFYHEDCDYGLRSFKKDISFNYCVSSKIIHFGGMSSRKVSWFAFENDIKGLLFIYKKHYSEAEFKKAKAALHSALIWRIFFLSFGFYKNIRQIGLYNEDKPENKKIKKLNAKKKYLELLRIIKDY